MKKIALIFTGVLLIILFGVVIAGGSKPNTGVVAEGGLNSEIKNGIQYVTINAKGGYFPNASNAQAGIPTKLIVKTKGTFDCSASLLVRSVGFQKILPQTGETEIDIGVPVAGVPLQGVCGMGMYSFIINF